MTPPETPPTVSKTRTFNTSHAEINSETLHITTPYGKLAVKRWYKEHSSSACPILLLHDSLGSIEMWRSFPAALARHTGRCVIAYDRIGFGRSAPITQPIEPNFITQEAEQIFPLLCQALQLQQVILFGHSVGGGMAVHIAARHPERCAGLITESAQAFVEPLTRSGIRKAEEMFQDPQQFERLARYHGERTQWVLDSWVNSWLSPAFDHWSLDEALPHVCCPTLVLHGAEDEYGSEAQPQRIAQGVSGPVQLSILSGMHHVPHREDETLVVSAVARFIGL